MARSKSDQAFDERIAKNSEELHELLTELYGEQADEAFRNLTELMKASHAARPADLKRLDTKRLADPEWYKRGNMFGMTMYTDLFAGDLKKLADKVPYLKEQKLTYLHLMPLLKMPHPQNDGGYAVEDFDTVDPSLGTNEDLAALTKKLRAAGISLCLDFVMNHTASSHRWAKAAQAGDPKYQDYYYCYDDRTCSRPVRRRGTGSLPGHRPWQLHLGRTDAQVGAHLVLPVPVGSELPQPECARVGALRACSASPTLASKYSASMPCLTFGRNSAPTAATCRKCTPSCACCASCCECVCPSVVLKGEVVMAPKELAAYFGTPEKPECHMLYNVSIMVNLWSALASGDVRLLKDQLDKLNALPENCWFVNYLRCHDDIGWGLDEPVEESLGIDPLKHKEFLYHFYEGSVPGSWAMGELYNYDEASKDARSCGTTASLCGVERALITHDKPLLDISMKRDLMMHSALSFLRGFPMLSCGDEIVQLNGWEYKEDPDRVEDSRNLHRSPFNWENAAKRKRAGTLQKQMWDGLKSIREMRDDSAFTPEAWVTTWDTHNDAVLAVVRHVEGRTVLGLFNFSSARQSAHLDSDGDITLPAEVALEPYQVCVVKK